MPNIKALTIEVSERSQQQGAAGAWQDLTSQIQAFTRDIVTPSIKQGVDVSAIVSGVPSVFARADLFNHALGEIQTIRNNANSGLNQYYINLVDEWRGLIACIALNNTAIDVRRIDLAYSDNKDIYTTANMYEPKGAFGNMLMNDRSIWTGQGKARNAQAKPFLYIIKYNGQVVGATSPRSIFFTSVAYDIVQQRPFVNPATHRFTDPLNSSIPDNQLLNLFAYVDKLQQRISQLENYYKNTDLDYQHIKLELGTWHGEILAEIKRRGLNVNNASALPVQGFDVPFRFLNYTEELYGYNGVITSAPDAQGLAKAFKPEDLLLTNSAEIARIWLPRDYEDNKNLSDSLPVYLLRAKINGSPRYAYFSIPLSEQGLQVFGENINILLGYANAGNNIDSRLDAEFDEATSKLSVRLTLTITDSTTGNRKQKAIPIDYHIKGIFGRNKDVVVWPNFIAQDWDRYFLFSEMPHNVRQNDCPYSAMPFCGEGDDFHIINNYEGHIDYLAENGVAKAGGKLLVVCDSRTASRQYKYEIYESKNPFKGVRLTYMNGQEAGFVLIHYSNDINAKDGLPKDRLHYTHELQKATVGIDFGSTNTSVAYHEINMTNAEGLQFEDQRISLFSELGTKTNDIPAERNVLFFQNEEIYSNAIKSILAIHDDQRLPQGSDHNTATSEAIQGGFPCFSSHLPINSVTIDRMRLGFKNGQSIVELVHNMKWSDREEDKAHKQAFLSSLLLHIYAELYVKDYVPSDLRWSYPSAMGYNLMNQYSQIWQSLNKVTPVTKDGAKYELTVARIPGINIQMGNDNDPFGSANTSNSNAPFASPFGSNNIFGGDSNSFGENSNPFGGSDNSFVNSGNVFGGSTDTASDGFRHSPFSDTQNASQQGANASAQGVGFDNDPFNDNVDSQTHIQEKPLELEKGPFKFDFKGIDTQKAMTEACAVANYLSYSINNTNELVFCFDVGGSTTDISVICNDGDSNKMLKQNSIRFAAQRLSAATKYVAKPFEQALQKICHNHNIKLLGFNDGERLYSAETAPYYFEQIVDQLSTQQLTEFYQIIGTDCPQLYCVDLYITGLISYYAGQLAYKLVKEARKSEELPMYSENWRPIVKIVFAGKGSRIFEWLNAANSTTALRYYTEMFCMGMGGESIVKGNLSGWPQFELHTKQGNEVKFEVSKGLAKTTQTRLLITDNVLEIIGENGFKLYNSATKEWTPLQSDDSITTDFMHSIGKCFSSPDVFDFRQTRFCNFASIYYKYVSGLFGTARLDINKMTEGLQSMANINTYIKNLPEVQKAQSKKKFDFVAPIIVLEGMKFYDEYLMDALY